MINESIPPGWPLVCSWLPAKAYDYGCPRFGRPTFFLQKMFRKPVVGPFVLKPTEGEDIAAPARGGRWPAGPREPLDVARKAEKAEFLGNAAVSFAVRVRGRKQGS